MRILALLLLMLTQEKVDLMMGILPGSKFDRAHYEVLVYRSVEVLPHVSWWKEMTGHKEVALYVRIPKSEKYKGTYLTVPLWPKCSATQPPQDEQVPFYMEGTSNDGFTLRGPAGTRIIWECSLLAKKQTESQ